jgi:hypothetical protein
MNLNNREDNHRESSRDVSIEIIRGSPTRAMVMTIT